MKNYCNREKSAATCRQTAEKKRLLRFQEKEWKCKICSDNIGYDDWKKGRKDLCRKKSCRSEINRANSLKQDKTRISEYVKNSNRWIEQNRKSLAEKTSKIEKTFNNIFSSYYENVEQQFFIKLEKICFVDFNINGVLIEIDGPFHKPEIDKILDEYILRNNLSLIRIDVTKNVFDVMSNLGKILKIINNKTLGVFRF